MHVWTDRPQRYWPQGIPRPNSGGPQPTQQVSRQATAQQASQQPPAQGAARGAQAPTAAAGTPPQTPPQAPPRWSMRTVDNAILRAMAEDPQTPPDGLHWDLFLGPVKEDVPYHPVYHPFSWRGWADFGVS